MNVMNINTFASSQQKTEQWLTSVKDHTNVQNEEEAYVVLRSVLHVLRDRLTVNQAVDFGAQLPILLTGVYYDGWTPNDKPLKIKSEEEFIDKIARDLPQNIDPRKATLGTLDAIRERVTSGEIKNIKSELPEDIEKLLSN